MTCRWELVYQFFFKPKSPEIPSISALDILEVFSGLTTEAASLFPDINEKAKARGFFVTLIFNPSLVLAIECANLDDRNFLVNGLRSLVAEVQLDMNATTALEGPSAGLPQDAVTEEVPIREKYEKLVKMVN